MNNDWSSLSMREKAEYIKDAVSRGLHTVDSIRNEYKDGGKKKRTALDIQAANKQIFLKSLELSLKGNSRYSSAGWRKYLTDLALLESGYLAGITNKIGAKGYFLLMPSNRASSWSSPTLLFEEMFKMTDSNIQYLKKNMTKADLAKALALGIDIYGLVAGAHLGGAKGALNALRGVKNSKDMNGTSVMKYMKLFSQSTPKLTEADYQSNYSTSDLNRNRIVMLPHVEPVDNTYVAPIEPRYSVNPTLLPQGEAEGMQTSLMSLIMLELESPKMLLVEEPEVESSPLTYILKVSRSSVPIIKTQTPNKVTTATDLYKKYYDSSSPTLLLLNLEEAIYRSNNNEFGNGGLKGNLYGGDNPNGQLMMTVGSIGYMPKIYAEKPDAIHVQKPDLPIIVEPDVSNAAALERQRRVYSNYDEALDNPLNPVQKVIYNGLRYLKDNVYEGIPSGVSNCTLTATQWVNPASPIKLASSIVNDPGKYNYSKISKEDALPGNLVIAKVPNLDSYHTMMLSGFADKDSTYTFDGKKYKITKGEPLVTYSRGGHDNSFIRRNIPLSVYTLNSDGHTENLFYRYNSPNEVFLPNVVVTAKKGNKRALGGNLFDDGGSYSYTKPLDNVIVDEYGNLLDPNVPSARGSIRTPDVVITANPLDVGRGKARRMLENAFIESNDATATPYTTNSHLNERGIEGAAKAAAWMQDNPTLNNVGMALGAVPLAVAGYPAFMAAGEGAATALANPYVDAALTSYFGAHGLNHAINEGIDGYGDAAMTALEIIPLGRLARPMWNAGKEAVYNIADRYMFMPHQNSFTRGIGGEAGLQDLVESGLVRGNPIGTEVTAKAYGKLTRSNRNNFNDIMRDTGIDDIAHRYYNRTLTEEDFNAIKKAAQKYKENTPSSGAEGRITLLRQDKDPLSKYSSYQDYQAQLTSDRQTLANATSLDDSGQPLAYFYDNGRNPLTAGHDYAASDYGVRINNASEYNPRIFDGHLHYSMPEAVPLRDPNVEVFKKGPFGLTYKLDKETMKPVWQRDLKTLFSKGTNKTPQITAENTASEMPNIIRTVLDNGKIRLSLPSHSEANPRQFVLEPQGDNKFYVHMRTWDGDHIPANITNEEKQQLFDALYNELPEGAEILFPKSGPGYYGTRGTVAGLQRLARDPRFTPGTKGTLQYLDKDGKTIKTYEGTSFIKIPKNKGTE